MEPLARTVNATRSYGPVFALHGVAGPPAGRLLGLLGRNIAGALLAAAIGSRMRARRIFQIGGWSTW